VNCLRIKSELSGIHISGIDFRKGGNLSCLPYDIERMFPTAFSPPCSAEGPLREGYG